jgi:phospholipase C
MRNRRKCLLLLAGFSMLPAFAQGAPLNTFKHVIVIFQENRTPDNLFHYLTPECPAGTLNASCYDIATSGLAEGQTQPVTLTSVLLDNDYDPDHHHSAFVAMCDPDSTGKCQMDGANQITDTCKTGATDCPGPNLSYKYVDNSTGTIQPYLDLVTQYGWANRMFQTNQGPSYPAHQFIFGGTSAPSAADDAAGNFVAENPRGTSKASDDTGCLAPVSQYNKVISPNPGGGTCPTGCDCFNNNAVKECKLVNSAPGTLCFTRNTMPTLFSSGITWKYYAPGMTANPANPWGHIWMAPASIRDLCVPDATYTTCTGPAFTGTDPNVDTTPSHVLEDIKNCALPSVSWVIPSGQNSDHAQMNTGGGPDWVASIVNRIGKNIACDSGGYWKDTAIVITWDDWGGWYDHVAPPVVSGVQGDYQLGFRVPLVVVSAYTPPGYINNARHDFGSILRLIQGVFNGQGQEGALGFADARADNDLKEFFSLTATSSPPAPRTFTPIATTKTAEDFLNDEEPPTAPDDDD